MNDLWIWFSTADPLVWFWSAMTLACFMWWIVMFVYIGIVGPFEIASMIRSLSNRNEGEEPSGSINGQ